MITNVSTITLHTTKLVEAICDRKMQRSKPHYMVLVLPAKRKRHSQTVIHVKGQRSITYTTIHTHIPTHTNRCAWIIHAYTCTNGQTHSICANWETTDRQMHTHVTHTHTHTEEQIYKRRHLILFACGHEKLHKNYCIFVNNFCERPIEEDGIYSYSYNEHTSLHTWIHVRYSYNNRTQLQQTK